MRYTDQLNCVQSVQIGARLGFQKLLFAKRSSTPAKRAAAQPLPRPRRARLTQTIRIRNASATPPQRQRNVSSVHIGSGEGAMRQPPRQQRATV